MWSLGLVWSNRDSIAAAVRERQGIYWSRSRGRLWRKGESSGATQHLLRVDLDCDRDTLRFTVRQEAPGFCHTGNRGCFGDEFGLGTLERTIRSRLDDPVPGSGTRALIENPDLLAAKLVEEARELALAEGAGAAEAEAADLIYFALTALVARAGRCPVSQASSRAAPGGSAAERWPPRSRRETASSPKRG